MKVRYWMFLAVFTLVISTFAFAGNSCALATQADTNGAIKDFDFAAPSSSLYYQFKVSAGHSYSVAVREPYDDGGNNDLTVTVASENTTCNTAVASPTVTTNAEPALATNGFRESFTAPANGTYSVVIANGDGAIGRYISLEINDTTRYSVRWSTFSGFITQWGFQNTTNQAISVKVTATGTLGGTFSGSLTFSVPANTQVYKLIGVSGGDLNTGTPQAGFLVSSNDGPPNGMLTDSYFINPSATVIVPSPFEAVRSLQH